MQENTSPFTHFSLHPSLFFPIEWECHHLPKAFLEESLTDIYNVPLSVSKTYLGWSEEGIFFRTRASKLQQIDLYLDTRDSKAGGFASRFCHHFKLVIESEESYFFSEVSTFRTEDRHPLCKEDDLWVEPIETKRQREWNLWLPAHVLHGYEPAQFDRLGVGYTLTTAKGLEEFSALSEEFNMGQTPSLWSSARLVS